MSGIRPQIAPWGESSFESLRALVHARFELRALRTTATGHTLNDQALRRQKSQAALHKLNRDSMGTWVDCLGKSLDIDISAKRSMPIQPPPKKVARSHQIETMIVSFAPMDVSYQVRYRRDSSQRWLRLSVVVISEIPIAIVAVSPMVASVVIVLCGNDHATGEQCAKQSKCQKALHPDLPNELGASRPQESLSTR